MPDIEHYHIRNSKCTAEEDYNVEELPYTIIVDQNGQIVHIGTGENGLEKNLT